MWPGNWPKARTKPGPKSGWISIIDGSVGLTGDYDRAQGGTADLDVRRLDYSVSKALRNLHRLTVQEGQEPWSEVVFTLKAGGNFALRFLR
jgi:hypothetical protein